MGGGPGGHPKLRWRLAWARAAEDPSQSRDTRSTKAIFIGSALLPPI
jgi:hypothetical protein